MKSKNPSKPWSTWRLSLCAAGGILFFWLLWALGVAPFLSYVLCVDAARCASLGLVGDLFGGVNALFAGLAFAGLVVSIEASRRATQEERIRAHDKEIFEQVCKSYEWAFQSLGEDSPPAANSSNWLNAATHLLRAKKLVAEIQTPTFQLLQEEHLEYWRFKFKHRLNHDDIKNVRYFFLLSQNKKKEHPNIYVVSAAVIAEFLIWSGEDLIGIDDLRRAVETPGFEDSLLGKGLTEYLGYEYHDFIKKTEKRSESQQQGKA